MVHAQSGAKIAGAAQKRNKRGLLFQGSLWKPSVEPVPVDWDRFFEDFASGLAEALQVELVRRPWPEYAEGEADGLTEQYSTAEWNERR